MKHPQVVAEIGCNHKGDLKIAKNMIEVASNFCGVNVAKFQKRSIDICLSKEEYNTPHPVDYHSYGKSYGKHREALEFTLDQHKELKDHCEQFGVTYASSVWDTVSAETIASLQPKLIKVPSACNTDLQLIEKLCLTFGGEVHVSTGMTTRSEIDEIVTAYERFGRSNDLILYACTSGYPVQDKDVCLLEIQYLKERYGSRIKNIGFSGHHLGIALDIAAFTLGANWIERHFTLDRTWKGTDHAASLEPDGMRRMVRNLKAVATAMKTKEKDILDVEITQRKKLKWDRHITKNKVTSCDKVTGLAIK